MYAIHTSGRNVENSVACLGQLLTKDWNLVTLERGRKHKGCCFASFIIVGSWPSLLIPQDIAQDINILDLQTGEPLPAAQGIFEPYFSVHQALVSTLIFHHNYKPPHPTCQRPRFDSCSSLHMLPRAKVKGCCFLNQKNGEGAIKILLLPRFRL